MNLRFAYSSLFWPNKELERNLALLAPNGFEGWETRESLDWLGPPQRLNRLCRDAGIEIAAVTGPNASRSIADEAHQICKRRIEYAADLGVALYMTKGPAHGKISPTPDAELDTIARVYEALAEHGQRLGVTVTYHPHEKHFVDSTEEWRSFMSRLKTCRLCLDVMHAVLWNYDPIQAAQDFASRISYIHLHGRNSQQPADLDDGPLCDYGQFLSAVENVGFSGWVVVIPGGQRPALESVQKNRTVLRNFGY